MPHVGSAGIAAARRRGLGTPVGAAVAPVAGALIVASALATSAMADPRDGDPGSLAPALTPRQERVPRAPRATEGARRATSDLDGRYLWLAPAGAAARVEGAWDSHVGAAATLVRVREGGALAVVGASAGASRWSARDGGRLWLDAVAGTRRALPAGVLGGVTAGALVELGDAHHPRPGVALGAWCFAGVTPFARVGVVAGQGAFVELGAQIALPVLRW